jgi:hypothetical protein
VVEGERDELGEAHKDVRSRRDEATAAEVDKVAEGEEGREGAWMRSPSMAALGSTIWMASFWTCLSMRELS